MKPSPLIEGVSDCGNPRGKSRSPDHPQRKAAPTVGIRHTYPYYQVHMLSICENIPEDQQEPG